MFDREAYLLARLSRIEGSDRSGPSGFDPGSILVRPKAGVRSWDDAFTMIRVEPWQALALPIPEADDHTQRMEAEQIRQELYEIRTQNYPDADAWKARVRG